MPLTQQAAIGMTSLLDSSPAGPAPSLLSSGAPVRLAGCARRTARWLCLAVLAAACIASSAFALTVDEARHLLTGTGLGAAPHEIKALLPLTREQAVERLLDGLTTVEVAPTSAFLNEPMTDYLQRLGDRAPADLAGLHRPMVSTSAEDSIHLTHQGMQEMAQLRVRWRD